MGKPSLPTPAPATGKSLHKASWLICLALLVGTFAFYWPVHTHDFVEIDDPDYTYENPRVYQGLSRASVTWAFQAREASNWHPITWLSHILDCELFGLRAGAHHLVSVGFHAANAVLLFLLLRQTTGAFWRAAFVAACFAWHPLRVESVVWISERKDVLSGFFGLLTLLAYVKYTRASRVQNPKAKGWYVAALVLFALGLMSKPMLVTLPCLMLLLDFWPLNRFIAGPATTGLNWSALVRAGGKLLPEKIPFFLLSAISCALTVWAQSAAHAMGSTQQFPLLNRMANAVLAYGKYLEKSFWPSKLAVFYPYPMETPMLAAIVIGSALLVVTLVLIRRIKQRPEAIVGWFWFLGMLMPVIGLVQVGGQSWADRYSYLPCVGLLILVAWQWAEFKLPRAVNVVLAAAVLAGCAAVTVPQVNVWRDSRTLFEHTRAVTDRNYLAWTVLAGHLGREGKLEEALQHYQTALQMQPDYANALTGMGNIYEKRGEYETALNCFDRALKAKPHEAEIVNGRSAVLARQGKFAEAEAGFLQALAMRPGYGEAIFNLGSILDRQGRQAEALARLNEAAALMPQSANVHFALGEALRRGQKHNEALSAYDRALQLSPKWNEARYGRAAALMELGRLDEAGAEFKSLLEVMSDRAPALDGYGFVLALQGQTAEAEKWFQQAIETNPRLANAHLHYAMMLAQRGDMRTAIRHYRTALDIEPNQPGALNNLAWVLATHPDDALRNGKDAVMFAQRACEMTAQREPFFLGTLAAAYAETGDFANARATAERAKEIALQAGRPDLAQRNEELLKFYRSGQPYRDTSPPR